MDNILFVYNIIITVLFTVNLTGFYFTYLRNNKKVYKLFALLYLLLIADNSIVYLTEYSKSFKLLYENSYLVYIIIYLIFIAIAFIYRSINTELFNSKISKHEIILFISLQILTLILVIIDPLDISSELIYFSFFTMLFFISLQMYFNLKKIYKQNKNVKWFLYIVSAVTILSVIAIIECILFYFSDSAAPFNALSLDYRIITHDLMKLLMCLLGLTYLLKSFNQTFEEKSLEDKVKEFCEKYSLTNRQQDIIQLIVEGKSNKEISSMLYITEGTVKTHIHNIFKKADITSRNQILTIIVNEN